MAGRPSSKKKKANNASSLADESTSNPETLERKRLKTLAFSNKILSQIPAKPHAPLAPSKTVAKHHGRDIVKKSHRKNRFLFSFPGLLAPISGGKIGELKDLGSKNPILCLEFPQGRMKLFGTIVYPKNRYLTLQFPRGGKNVMCEDYFDNMIVFSDAWWIGRQDENPEESRLDFPKELSDGKQADYDFKGGAGGVACANGQVGLKNEVNNIQDRSPSPMLGDDSSDDENKDPVNVTPVRQSARTAGKKFKFAEASPEDDSITSDADESEEDEKTTGKKENASVVFEIDDEDPTPNQGAPSGTESNKQSLSSVKIKRSGEDSGSNRGSLIQTTISSLFKKVEEKKTSTSPKKTSSAKVSAKKAQQTESKRKSIQDGASAKKAKVNEKNTGGKGKGKGKKKAYESEDDDIEEFSSDSLDNDGSESDEDWEA